MINKQFTKSKLLKHYSVYTIGRILGVISSLILLPLFTKKIPQEEFGIIGILWIAGPILTRLVNLGVDVAVSLKFYKLDHKELSNYLFNSLFVILLLASGVWILFYVNINWVHLILDPSMTKQVFSLFFFSITSTVLLTMMRSFLQLASKAWQNVLFTVLPPVIISALTYYLIIVIKPSYTSYITGMAVGNGIFGFVALIYFFRNYSIQYFRPSLDIIKKLLRIGIPVLPGTLAGLTLAAGDRYIIKHFLGLDAVAIYIYGYRFSEYILISIFQPFQKSIVPIIMKKAAKNFKDANLYSQKLTGRFVGYITIIVAAIIIPFKDVMHLLSKDDYTLSYDIFLVSLLGILLNNISNIFSILINHLERTDLNMGIGVTCALINIGLNLWLIPIYGILAAAFTTVISFLIALLLSISLLNRFVHNKISIVKTLIGIVPILLYLIMIYTIDSGYVIDINKITKIYGLKMLAFSSFLLFSYIISAELRNDVKQGVKYFSETIWTHI